MKISAVNGTINLKVPTMFNADIDMNTVNGSVNAEGFQITLGKISKKHITGKIGTGGQNIKIETVNGSINLEKK
jgi:DUF4097 and DUF4098 domain-containing protein YvlB